jgi:hypothetical protein
MAQFAQYPQGSDVSEFLASCGLVVAPDFDFDTPAREAQEEWEQRAGWFPFLNVKGDELIVLDNSERGWGWGASGYGSFGGGFGAWRSGGRILDLECGVLSVKALKINEQLLTEGRDYRLMPRNARRAGLPFTFIDFFGWGFNWALIGNGEVWITAKCGYCDTLPARVWSAVLRRAVSRCAPQISLGISGGLAEHRRGDELQRYSAGVGSGPLAEQIAQWDSRFEQIVLEFSRIAL